MSFAIPVSVLEKLQNQFKSCRIKTKKLGGEEELGTVRAAILIEGDAPGSNSPIVYGSKLGFLVETDAGAVEVWSAGTLSHCKEGPLLDGVRDGDWTTAQFANLIGIPLDAAEELIRIYGKQNTAQT